MYKIGEFSKMTDMTIASLRYYDEKNILKPASRLENGYRSYNQENYEKAIMIKKLRELDFSIAEVKDVLDNIDSREDIQYYLEEKKSMVENRIIQEKELIKKIESFITYNDNKGERVMNYELKTKEYSDIFVLSKRFKGSVKDSGELIPKMYQTAKASVSGDLMTLYYDMEYTENDDIEICVPVKKDVSNSEFIYRKLDGGKYLVTTHIGKYEDLGKAYKALIDYSNEHNIKITTPYREIYIKGPGMVFKGNPAKYVTEIAVGID